MKTVTSHRKVLVFLAYSNGADFFPVLVSYSPLPGPELGKWFLVFPVSLFGAIIVQYLAVNLLCPLCNWRPKSTNLSG
ncbi:hypothetical protein EV363DRAFT_631708 [Boletus edulis]|nr:hypothetical protein EV363DRAFT_631708 [Boletus edulis]